jgi:PKD repeat protein
MHPAHLGAASSGRARRAAIALGLLGVSALIVLAGASGLPTQTGSASSAPTLASPSVVAAAPAAVAPVASTHPGTSADCAALSAGWQLLDGARPSPAILPSLESPCTLDHDVAGVYFVSDAPGSGAHTEFDLTLPANGTDPGGAYSAFWLGMWVSGIGCSYDQESYLTVELIPPYATAAGVAGVPWWTVEAPVWDLVPAGSCDPQCQNDTAFFTVGGRSYCEDDALLSGFGALTGAGRGALDPGDTLSVALVGTAGGPSPLAVYVNDSTDPSRSLSWNYSGTAIGPHGLLVNQTVTGQALVPLYSNASSTNGGWTGGLDVGFGWFNCPAPLGNDSYASACDSYDRSIAPGASPEIDRVLSYDRTSHTYSNLYPTVETESTSGACAGTPTVAPCADFTTYGGSGDYPVFGIGGSEGRSWLTYGPADASNIATLASRAGEFPTNASLSAPLDLTVVGNASTAAGSNSVSVQFRVTDPVGVTRVTVAAWWCNSGLHRSVATFAATLVSAPYNTPTDGNWTALVPTSGDVGSFYYSAQALSNDGTWTYGAESNVTLTGTGSTCPTGYPTAPVFSPSSISPIGGGYDLNWTENTSSGATSYTVVATTTHGGRTTHFALGNVTSARLVGLAGNASYNLSVSATNPVGLSTSSPIVHAPSTWYVLAIRPVNLTDSSPWAGHAILDVSDNVTGGLNPYEFDFSFGDGTSNIVWTTSGEASTVHDFPVNYSGIAVVLVSVVDSAGDSISAPTVFVTVQGPPTGVHATISGGTGFVQLRWTPPSSPGPFSHYQVYWTTDAVWAPYLTAAWPSNASVPEISENTTTRLTFAIAASDGTEVYAQVVAWNSYGEGLLPSEPAAGEQPYLSAASSNLVGTLVSSAAGGPAPFTDFLNASFVLAPGDALVSAVYGFSPGGTMPATIGSANLDFWANASVTFNTPGPVNVALHVTDALNQSTVLTTSLYVSPGPAPIVAVKVSPTPVWANSAVEFTAQASAGSGQYSYNWSFGDGGTATGSVVNYSYLASGAYVVSVAVTDTEWGGTSTEWAPVTVYAVPTVQIVESSTANYGSYQFTALPTGGLGNFTYTWLFSDGSSLSGASVTHTFAGSGNYSVTVQATDGYGHVTTNSTYVVVPSSPGSTSSTSGGTSSTELIGALILLVIALAVVAAILAIRQFRRRRSEEDDPAGDPVHYGTDPPTEPSPPPAEEEPPLYR